MSEHRIAARAFALLVLGAACIGCAPLLVRLADVGPVASAFWRMALAAPVLWLVARRFEATPAAAGTTATAGGLTLRRAGLLSGLFFAGDLAVWHFSITMTTVANSTLLANCAPIVVTVYAWLAYRQRPRPAFMVALLLAMAGAFTLVGPNFRAGGRALSGDLLGFVTSGFYSAYMLCINRAQARGTMLRLIALTTTVSAIVLLPVAWGFCAALDQPFWPHTGQGWLVVVALALLTQSLGQGSITYALTHLPVSLSATTLLLQPLLSTLGAWLLFGERLGAAQLAGGAVLLAAIWLARRSAR